VSATSKPPTLLPSAWHSAVTKSRSCSASVMRSVAALSSSAAIREGSARVVSGARLSSWHSAPRCDGTRLAIRRSATSNQRPLTHPASANRDPGAGSTRARQWAEARLNLRCRIRAVQPFPVSLPVPTKAEVPDKARSTADGRALEERRVPAKAVPVPRRPRTQRQNRGHA
jgi:hypothetical protein